MTEQTERTPEQDAQGREVWLVVGAFNPFGLRGTFGTRDEAVAFASAVDGNKMAYRCFVIQATEFQSGAVR